MAQISNASSGGIQEEPPMNAATQVFRNFELQQLIFSFVSRAYTPRRSMYFVFDNLVESEHSPLWTLRFTSIIGERSVSQSRNDFYMRVMHKLFDTYISPRIINLGLILDRKLKWCSTSTDAFAVPNFSTFTGHEVTVVCECHKEGEASSEFVSNFSQVVYVSDMLNIGCTKHSFDSVLDLENAEEAIHDAWYADQEEEYLADIHRQDADNRSYDSHGW